MKFHYWLWIINNYKNVHKETGLKFKMWNADSKKKLVKMMNIDKLQAVQKYRIKI